MKILSIIIAALLACACTAADAKGGASSGGGGHASSAGHSASVRRGGFSSSPASRPAPAPMRPATPSAAPQVHTTTTINRTVNYGGGYAPGYYHNDGFVTGLVIGNMMHPQNTVVYAGPGPQGALLYPDGRVVNQQGQQIGVYQNGQYTEIQNGAIVAQPAPPEPEDKGKSVWDWVVDILLVVFLIVLIVIFAVVLFGFLP